MSDQITPSQFPRGRGRRGLACAGRWGVHLLQHRRVYGWSAARAGDQWHPPAFTRTAPTLTCGTTA